MFWKYLHIYITCSIHIVYITYFGRIFFLKKKFNSPTGILFLKKKGCVRKESQVFDESVRSKCLVKWFFHIVISFITCINKYLNSYFGVETRVETMYMYRYLIKTKDLKFHIYILIIVARLFSSHCIYQKNLIVKLSFIVSLT